MGVQPHFIPPTPLPVYFHHQFSGRECTWAPVQSQYFAVTTGTYQFTLTAVSEVNGFIPHPPCISLRFSNKCFLFVRIYLASFSILTWRSFLNYSLAFWALCYTLLLKQFRTHTRLSAAGIECRESLWCSSQSHCHMRQ